MPKLKSDKLDRDSICKQIHVVTIKNKYETLTRSGNALREITHDNRNHPKERKTEEKKKWMTNEILHLMKERQ